MTPLGEPLTHYWLAQRTARAIGVDLTQAMAEGRLDQADWAEMVHRCRGCASPGACAQRLDQPEPLTEPPVFCRNTGRFADLAQP